MIVLNWIGAALIALTALLGLALVTLSMFWVVPQIWPLFAIYAVLWLLWLGAKGVVVALRRRVG
jgi:hypothetical protein